MPSKVYLVTGGARSGKSGYAQTLCESLCPNPIYLATSSNNWDDDFKERIQRHQQERGERWTTMEEPMLLSQHVEQFASRVVMLDCLTLWLTNFMIKEGAFGMPEDDTSEATSGSDPEAPHRALEAAKEEFDKLVQPWNVTYVVVTNEVGSGTHASEDMTRRFVDAQGWFNQYVAARADRVVHMVSGIPNVLKEVLPKTQEPMPKPTQEQRSVAIMLDNLLSARPKEMEANGYWIIRLDWAKTVIVAEFFSCILNDKGEVCDLEGKKIPCCGNGKKVRPEPLQVFEGRTAKELTVKIFEQWSDLPRVMTRLDHAVYVGRECQKAEYCLYAGEAYRQD